MVFNIFDDVNLCVFLIFRTFRNDKFFFNLSVQMVNYFSNNFEASEEARCNEFDAQKSKFSF